MSPNYVRAALAAALLAVVAIALAACGQEGAVQTGNTGNTGKNEQELVDAGPNAGLSNGELVNMAVTNMRRLSNFHMDFNGPVAIERNPVQQMTLAADVQLRGPGDWSGGDVRGEGIRKGTPVPGSRFQLSVDAYRSAGTETPAQQIEIIWATDGAFYSTSDGGATWKEEPYAMWLLGYFFGCWGWVQYWDNEDVIRTPTAAASSNLVFKDGSPRLERVDGVVTRHVIADVTGISVYGPWSDTPTEIHLWISMDATPTVRKLIVKGDLVNEQTGSEPYALTWTWSRFNENFGEVKPPPVQTIKEP